ncbi:MAG: exosortase B [Rhizobiales bacterium]|nr:exosortase B [Rhizobacter sp.]
MDFVRHDPRDAAESSAPSTLFPPGSDRIVLGLVFCGLALLYLPTYWALSKTVWQNADQSQGPLMLAASLWLLYDQRAAIAALPARPMNRLGGALLGFGLLLYVVGRSQSIWLFEVGSQLFVWSALLLLFKGAAALRLAWFSIFFLIFMVPLPGPIVAAVTGPLKAGVSYVASEMLFALGYPVSRAGVILTVGPYLILVADACAGLTSMFSLEAVGLLYLKIVKHPAAWRNALLAVLVVPIAFCANVVRVLILVLVTYHLGDAAGRGFLHAFAGLVLFVVAIAMIFAVDHLIGFFAPKPREAAR